MEMGVKPGKVNPLVEWQKAGTAPQDGYYWVKWRCGLRNETEPRISEFYEGYVFALTTMWAGPILPPNRADTWKK